MVEANIRRLSRMELIYKCISKLVTWLHKNGHDDLIKTKEHYYDPSDFNVVIYHCRSTDTNDRIQVLLDDIDFLLDKCDRDFEDVTEYQLFIRCVSEQTIVENGKRRLLTKEDKKMTSDTMQNHSAPDAIYREKSGRQHRGYVANIEESVSENGSIVTDYQFEKNNVSDSQMLKDHISDIGHKDEKGLPK